MAFEQISPRSVPESDWMRLIQLLGNMNRANPEFGENYPTEKSVCVWSGTHTQAPQWDDLTYITFDTNERTEVFFYESNPLCPKLYSQSGSLKCMRPAIRLEDQKVWAFLTSESKDYQANMIYDFYITRFLRQGQYLPDGRSLVPFFVSFPSKASRLEAGHIYSNASQDDMRTGTFTPFATETLFAFLLRTRSQSTEWRRTYLEIMYLLALDLAHLHARGVIHLDLKPENILLFQSHDKMSNRPFQYRPLIIDFDCSDKFHPANSASVCREGRDFYIGTYAYAEPRPGPRRGFKGSWKDATKLDIYGLACVFSEMLLTARPGMIEYEDIFGNVAVPAHVAWYLDKHAGSFPPGERAPFRPNGIWLGRQQPVSSGPLRSLLLRMSSPNLNLRPTALEVAEVLGDMIFSGGSTLRRAWFWPETMLWP
ncbi:MAG: hypothetical protein AAF355_01995 [Myxococcota bacterium]